MHHLLRAISYVDDKNRLYKSLKKTVDDNTIIVPGPGTCWGKKSLYKMSLLKLARSTNISPSLRQNFSANG